MNTPHTGTTLRHPQNWLCRLRCRISLRHQALISPLGHIFPRPHASPRNNQKHKLTVTPKFISPNSKPDFRYILRIYFPRTSNNTRCYLNFLITPFRLFTSFLPTRLAAQTQTKYSMLQLKTTIKTFRHLGTSLLLLPYKLSEETTQRKHTHARYNLSSLKINTIFHAKNLISN